MTTVSVAIVPVIQWNAKDLDGILHAENRLYMKIPKTYDYLLVTDIGNTVMEYGQRYNIGICKEMFGIFTDEIDTVVGMNMSNALKSMIKENK